MPQVTLFRALRYDPEAVGDLAKVVAPPYDVISDDLQRRLLERHPANVVRLDLPPRVPGEDPDDRYRQAARSLATWRSAGFLLRDPRPALYAYEQSYRIPRSAIDRIQRGFFCRLRLEPFGPGGGILPHERTMSGPKEDRYRLLRATAANTSPVVALYEDPGGRSETLLEAVAEGRPLVDLADDDGVRHRLWSIVDDGPPRADGLGAGPELGRAAGVGAELAQLAGGGPITIADGHHRYETALRYRDERRGGAVPAEDAPHDHLLALLIESHRQQLTVLPTHRIVRNLGDDGVADLVQRLPQLFDVESGLGGEALTRAFGPEGWTPGEGRFGLWTRAGGWMVRARAAAFEPLLPVGSDAVRRLDVVRAGIALEVLAGIDAAAVARGDRLAYSHDVAEALDRVDKRREGADAAFLLDPTPVERVVAVAAGGEVMPQKSTYFFPKALSGLVINPHEW